MSTIPYLVTKSENISYVNASQVRTYLRAIFGVCSYALSHENDDEAISALKAIAEAAPRQLARVDP